MRFWKYLTSILVLVLTICSCNKKPTVLPLTIFNQNHRLILGTSVALSVNELLTASHICIVQDPNMPPEKMPLSFQGMHQKQMYVIYKTGYYPVHIQKIDYNWDLCLLKIDENILLPSKLAKADYQPQQFDKVFALGYPSGMGPILTEGYITPQYQSTYPMFTQFHPPSIYISSNAIYSGNSGGPLFDKDNQVIGIIIKVHAHYSHISIAVDIKTIHKFLD